MFKNTLRKVGVWACAKATDLAKKEVLHLREVAVTLRKAATEADEKADDIIKDYQLTNEAE